MGSHLNCCPKPEQMGGQERNEKGGIVEECEVIGATGGS